MGMGGCGSDQDVGSNKMVMIRMGVEVAIEVMEMMELRVVGVYVLGVEMEPPAGVGWALAGEGGPECVYTVYSWKELKMIAR